MAFHQTLVVGNLGGDPQVREYNGREVANFSVAVTDVWKDAQGDKQERTTWYKVAVWGKQAAACSTYLKKGRQVLVEGRISASAYLDKNGDAQASLDLIANRVQFLGSRNDGGSNGSPAAPAEPEEDEIPF